MEIILMIVILLLSLLSLIIILFRKSKIDISEELKELENTLLNIKNKIDNLEKSINDDFHRNRIESSELNKSNREELASSLRSFETSFKEKIDSLNSIIRLNFSDLNKQQLEINKLTTNNVKDLRESIDKHLRDIREDNNKQLEEMRKTVDEKLQKTLNERLSLSFETVSKQLQSVQEGLGEMKTLASDVGGLKKVLSNVKQRGGIGEIQLEMLLEQILAPDQYQSNVKTKQNSSEFVEFAIKLPGKDDNRQPVWLPIDAKFPKDMYEKLVDSYDSGDLNEISNAQKNLEKTILIMAKDINEKYLEPPNTTDFGIMFLPFEGIYAEVVRKASLLETLHRKYKIIVTGPTTLAAILNSLQMGFKTLAIEKRSSEVWNVLGAVKTEFTKFEELMTKAQKNIQTGLNQLDDVMGKRTKAIQRKLRDVEALDETNKNLFLPETEE